MKSDSAGQPPSRPSSRALSRAAENRASSAWVDLHRLKLMSVVLPIVYVVAMELGVGRLVGSGWLPHQYQLAVELFITVLAITAFGLVMFRFIDRAQAQVLRQNRDLAATNAVSTAVRGELGVDRIIDVALESVMSSTGATEVSVTVFAPEGSPLDHETHHRRAESGPTPAVPDDGRSAAAGLVEIPLSTGTRFVGRMRLHLPAGSGERDGLGSGTLQVIGQQLANAIQIAQLVADLERRNHEGHVFHDVLLQISNQSAPADILASVVRHARDLPGTDDAVLCLNEGASGLVRFQGGAAPGGGSASITSGPTAGPGPDSAGKVHEHHLVCPVRSSSQLKSSLTIPLRGAGGILGDLWVARQSDVPFTALDEDYLGALCGLAAIALTSAQARENERLGAILAERERIAREMHDSLAQVLGVTHLRLRALDSREDVSGNREVAEELGELADICEEAYRDVREAILGLRESSRTERGLVDALGAYLAKYTQQCGIETSLETGLDHELALSPRSEVQVIRVIQEALTNVRKHSGAKSAVVRITETDSGTTFVVEDDGQGFDHGGSALDRDGFGLFTMHERMGLLNGSLTIDSPPGHGTRVIASVPERSHPKQAPVEVKSAAGQTDPHPARGRSAALPWGDSGSDRRAG
jgi:signal transduction histidine kinase